MCVKWGEAMGKKPLFVNLKYSMWTGLSVYVHNIQKYLPYESVVLDAVGGSTRGGFVGQVTSSMKARKTIGNSHNGKERLVISLDGRYQYSDMIVVHHLPESSANRIEKMLIMRALKHAKHCVAISNATAEELKEQFKEKDIFVVKNGVDLHEPITRKDHDGIFVSQIGGIAAGESRRKPMLQIPSLLRKAFPDDRVTLTHIAGRENENEQAFRKACEENGITPDFRTNVPKPDLWEIYANTDLYVYMSTKEGYSATPMEALSMGTPCLLSDIPIHREFYGDKDGVMFAQNWKVTPEKIREAYEQGISMSYRNKAVTRTWEDTAKDLDKVISELL